MGAYLAQPDLTKHSESYSSDTMHYSACSMQGWRRNQEDAHIANLRLPNGEAIFGVFDGHGGEQVAQFVEKKFVEVFTKLPEYKEKRYEDALKACFIKMDEMMNSSLSHDQITAYSMSTGCTSCVALLTADTIYCANSGDSRCVLARGTKAVELSEDHKPDNEGEKKRIEFAGGFVEDGRVNGSLSLSRALGDMEYKQNKKLPVEKQSITCVPDLHAEKIHPNDEFLIIACDGIWDCQTSQ